MVVPLTQTSTPPKHAPQATPKQPQSSLRPSSPASAASPASPAKITPAQPSDQFNQSSSSNPLPIHEQKVLPYFSSDFVPPYVPPRDLGNCLDLLVTRTLDNFRTRDTHLIRPICSISPSILQLLFLSSGFHPIPSPFLQLPFFPYSYFCTSFLPTILSTM